MEARSEHRITQLFKQLDAVDQILKKAKNEAKDERIKTNISIMKYALLYLTYCAAESYFITPLFRDLLGCQQVSVLNDVVSHAKFISYFYGASVSTELFMQDDSFSPLHLSNYSKFLSPEEKKTISETVAQMKEVASEYKIEIKIDPSLPSSKIVAQYEQVKRSLMGEELHARAFTRETRNAVHGFSIFSQTRTTQPPSTVQQCLLDYIDSPDSFKQSEIQREEDDFNRRVRRCIF